MWYGSSTILVLTAVYMYRKHKSIACSGRQSSLDKIKNIHHAVRLLQNIARTKPTEDVVSHIECMIVEYGIIETTLVRLSRLQKQYGNGQGKESYAINLIWSTVVFCISNGAVIICE